MIKISALILTRNEEEMIEDCLRQLDFVDEIIILDQNSKDQTIKIAKKFTDKIHQTSIEDFSKNRNTLSQLAQGEWLLYLDADERIDKDAIEELKSEIARINQPFSAFYFPRKNYILGKWLRHGGWWPDYVPRLFKKDKLITWEGKVHESPKVEGKSSYFKTPIVHLSGRTLSLMLAKTIKWAKIEAGLYYLAKSPKVSILKIIKAATEEFTRRYILKMGFLDGTVGLIESMFQAIHKMIILTYLWELQNKTEEKFKQIKTKIS